MQLVDDVLVQELQAVEKPTLEILETIENRLREQHNSNPQQFPGTPTIMKHCSRVLNFPDFDNEPPWPGEWDNTGGG